MILPLRNTPKAFTLVELLISVSIIVIVTAAIVPTFSTYLGDQTLKNAKQQFKDDLRTVQNKSLTGSSYGDLVSGGSVGTGQPSKYWVVKWVVGKSYYRVYLVYDVLKYYASYTAFCNALPVDSTAFGTAGPKATFSLPNSVAFSNTNGCLFFNMATGLVAFSNGSVDFLTSGTIPFAKDTTTATVSWNFAGRIGN